MPQHPCPCPWFNADNGNAFAWGTGTGATGPAAITAADTAQQAHALTQANNLAAGHTCAQGCVLVGKLTWNIAPRGSFIMAIAPDGAGGWRFTAFSFGKFTAQLRCKQMPFGVAEALGEGVAWEIRKAP